MSKPFILVLNATNPSRLSHLRKFCRLRKRFDFLLLYDSHADVAWQADFFRSALPVNVRDLANELPRVTAAIAAHGRPDGVLNLSEFCVPLQTELCGYYHLPGPTPEAALYGRNKAEMRKLLADLHMPVPRSVNLTPKGIEEAKGLRFPAVVKPTCGGGSALARRCETFDELIAYVKKMEPKALSSFGMVSLSGTDSPAALVAEELIGGTVLFDTTLPLTPGQTASRTRCPVGEIAVDSVYDGKQTYVLAIHDKPLPANGPYFEKNVLSLPSRIPARLQRKVADYVDRIHRRLNTYVLHSEFRTFPDALVPIEFAVRLGGSCIYSTIRYATGNDYLEILLDLCQGRKPQVRSGPAVPTIAHLLWAPQTGRIRRFSGEVHLIRSPDYLEHQLYDDIGTVVLRAPFSSRGHGHVICQSEEGFAPLEARLRNSLERFQIEVDTSLEGEVGA